jgi:tRNA pseudouridine55 synthase
MEQIEEICKQGRIGDVIMSVEKAFEMYGGIRLDRRLTELYKNGVKLYRSQLKEEQQGDIFRVFGSDGSFLGLAAFKDDMLTSVKNFY